MTRPMRNATTTGTTQPRPSSNIGTHSTIGVSASAPHSSEMSVSMADHTTETHSGTKNAQLKRVWARKAGSMSVRAIRVIAGG